MENRIMYQNRATLIGFLGKDAEVKTTRNNASFTVLSLATKRSWYRILLGTLLSRIFTAKRLLRAAWEA
jgi:hypothetical protein